MNHRPMTVSPERYRRFKDEVRQWTNRKQRLAASKQTGGLTDAEIAERLQLSVQEVTEIRCILEIEELSLEELEKAEEIKETRFRNPPVMRP